MLAALFYDYPYLLRNFNKHLQSHRNLKKRPWQVDFILHKGVIKRGNGQFERDRIRHIKNDIIKILLRNIPIYLYSLTPFAIFAKVPNCHFLFF